MVALTVEGIDLFTIAGRSISGWMALSISSQTQNQYTRDLEAVSHV